MRISEITKLDKATTAVTERAITKVGFGTWAYHDGGAGCCDDLDIGSIRMRRVHQMPAAIDGQMAGKPSQRTVSRGGEAIVDFSLLLCNVDMDRSGVALTRAHKLGH